MTAPTHKAVRVLKKQSEFPDKLDFGTIHSFLGLKQVIIQHGPKQGEVDYQPDFDSRRVRKIDSVHILIVDETSMLDDKLFGYIEDEMRSNPYLRVIYTGDKNQLPPVGKKEETGEHRAIPFIPERQKSHRIGYLEITEPQRQAADSPIIMYAHTILDQYKKKFIDFDFKDEHKHALEVVPRNKQVMEDLIRKYFQTEEFRNDPDYCKILAWRNTTVDYLNNMVRDVMYNFGDEKAVLPKIIVGEKLIIDEPVVKGDRVVLPKNEDVVVKTVEVGTYALKYKFIESNVFAGGNGYDPLSDTEKNTRAAEIKVYKVTLIDNDGFPFSSNIVHEDSEELYNSIRESIRKAALRLSAKFDKATMWKEWYAVKDKFIWTNYNYALTIHNSQGSSYQFCISNEWDIAQQWDISERNSLRYVASTRPRQKLFIIK